jgi:hypothetical protein
MTAPAERYDVYVSYRRAPPDSGWVRRTLVPALRSRGLRVFVDYESFVLGRPLVLETARAVEVSRYSLAVMTPRYLEGTFLELENVMAQQLGQAQTDRRLLGVLREPCHPRLDARMTLILDMTDDEAFPEQLELLVAALGDQTGR